MNAVRVAAVPEPYQTEGKALARAVVMEMARVYESRSILDLWGGGASARAFREALPEAVVTSCDSNQQVWAEMRQDAQLHEYAYWCGDVADVQGRFDFIWLDGMGPASRLLAKTLRACVRKLQDGLLVLTVMPAREKDDILAVDRLYLLPIWLERVTGLQCVFFLPYQRNRGLSMWLFAFQKGAGTRHSWAGNYRDIEESLAEDKFWEGTYNPGLYGRIFHLVDPDREKLEERKAEQRARACERYAKRKLAAEGAFA